MNPYFGNSSRTSEMQYLGIKVFKYVAQYETFPQYCYYFTFICKNRILIKFSSSVYFNFISTHVGPTSTGWIFDSIFYSLSYFQNIEIS